MLILLIYTNAKISETKCYVLCRVVGRLRIMTYKRGTLGEFFR